ncbi:MAG: mechanosensitive ion channel family protein [Sedimentisphaerales bacterium]|nr:mechanosensitive ion channel family protein [Sedimentisphaerales bacterium]
MMSSILSRLSMFFVQAVEGGAPEVGPQGIDIKGWADYFLAGNELWRFGALLAVIFLGVLAARIARAMVEFFSKRLEKKVESKLLELFLRSMASPVGIAVFAVGFYVARFTLKFNLQDIAGEPGFSSRVFMLWGQISKAILAIAVSYFLYRMVDILEYYLKVWTSRTKSTLDDMFVPVIRKTLRIFIAIVASLFIADNILKLKIGPLLAAAGVGGLAFALAAKETIANFFGSINIFVDRPFQIGERIKIGGFDGPVEDVGFRSTRIRTLDGHQVSIPNSMVANEKIENIARRPYIKRVANITITYDTPSDKVEKAVQIIKDVLAHTEEVNRDADLAPRVFFNEFNEWSLNILVLYWFTPPNYWDFQQTNERINLAIMRGFEAEGIEFAFPTQTLYVKKEDD